MTSQPVEANVVLTADNSQYDQSMTASAGTTEQLMASVDQLTTKVSKMTKTAGKSLIGITAADTALIGGATKAWSDYEKQMSRLQSQSAVLSRTNDQQNKVMKDYTGTVKNLRSEFGTTTTEAAKLVETLSKVTDVRQTRQLKDLTETFTKMGKATGESSDGLASSLTNLQKVMGDPITAKTTKQYADTFTYLAAQTGTSAQGLMDFTAQLAPVAKGLGMNTKEVAGFATAFTKAGADGGAAATAFTKVTGDMLRSIQSGSPEMAHYANMVGMTQRQFSKLARDDSAEAVVQVFESLANNSKTASTELARLGLDGPRTIRQIMSMTNQPGGIRAAMGLAEDPRARGSVNRGYQATMAGLSDEFDKLQEDLKQTAEAFATYLGPALEMFLRGMEKAASVVQSITEGPLGKFMQMVAGFLAPLAGAAGLLLLFAGALVKVASAFTLLRSSAAYGLKEGFGGRAGLTKTGTDEAGRSIYGPMGGGRLGTRGAQLAEDGTWIQRGMYNAGTFAGQGLGAFKRGGAVPESWYATREALSAKMPWTSQYIRPTEGTMRTPLSYVAGGLASGINQFVTPTFDQMRYADPTKRTQWAGREAPWSSISQRMGLVKSMGAVGLAETQMVAQRAEYAKVKADPLMLDDAREARLAELREIHRETAARRNAATAQETASREVIASQQRLTRENESTAVGGAKLGESLRKLGANVGGGILGGARAGAGAFMRSGLAGPTLAMGGLAATSALGIDNGMLTGGMTGAMIGGMAGYTGIGAGVGLTVGAIQEAQKQAEEFRAVQRTRAEALKQNQASAFITAGIDAQNLNAPWQRQDSAGLGYKFTHPGDIVGNIGRGLTSARDFLTGAGDSSSAREKEAQTAKAQNQALAGALSTISSRQGENLGQLDLSKQSDLDKLDGVVTKLAPAMDQLGVSTEDIIKTYQGRNTVEGDTNWKTMLTNLSTPGRASGMWDRLRGTEAGAAMLDSKTARQSIRFQGDVGKFYEATNEVFTSMRKSGMSNLEIVKSTEQAQQRIGDENTREYELQMAMSQKAQQALQMQAPQIGRAATFSQQLQLGATVMGIKPKTEEQAAQIETQKAATVQAVADNDAYFRQLLLAQEAYERSRTRAQEDYSLQRQYQEYDYNLQRTRAEEQFNRMRGRAVADYHRSVTRAWADFHLQRRRQEEDYQHQIDVTAQQQATGMNLYQRVDTQRTSSATWLLSNTKDILSRLREQKQNLNRLRDLGFSDQVIQQLQLTDPSNAQELSRFVVEVEQDRRLVGKFNRAAGGMQRASRALVTDESSQTFQEMQRSFHLNRRRGMDDMNRTMARGHEDFQRGLHQQADDFNLMMDQQAEDYQTQMNRQEAQYQRTMHRAAVDMAHMADEVTGSIESVLVRAHKKLTGSAREQAGIALQSFRDLKTSTSAEAVALMQNLSDVFGFKYENPLKGGGHGGGSAGTSSFGGATTAQEATGTGNTSANSPFAGQPYYAGGFGGPSGGVPRHEGGMVPGWTPGRDTVMVNLSGGEAIMRPEWARRVGEKNIDAMNHQAKHGGYAKGGVVWPLPGSNWSTYPGHDGIDLNQPGGDYGHPFYAAVPGRISYTGTAHGYGNAIFESGPYGTLVYGHGSKVAVHSGEKVKAGQYIGNVGSTGHSTGPHLHFGFPGGTPQEALALLHGALHGRYGDVDLTGGAPQLTMRQALARVMKHRYPRSEHAAAAMTGVHPLGPGMISKVINRYLLQAARHHRSDLMASAAAIANPHIGNQPTEHLGNEQLVHTAANRMGWGDEWAALRQIIMHESSFNNTAQNPNSSAYGMFQFLDSTWGSYGGHKTSDPWDQTRMGLKYIKDRYGDPKGAWKFWREHNWYGDGAMFNKPTTIGVGERGPEAVIPLNDRGGEFLARSIGLTTTAGTGGSLSVHNYRIDRSTTFSGPIMVQANDPNELIAKLQARQRVRALSRPVLTGSAA
jgi:TP901 family phage tail tape measure protein